MRRKILLLFAVVGILMSAFSVSAVPPPSFSRPVQIRMNKRPKPDYIPKNDEEGRRSSPKPILCSITPDGLNIPDVPNEDVYLYEVYTQNEELNAAFSSERQFLEYIYTLEDTVEIRLYTSEFVLCGFFFI